MDAKELLVVVAGLLGTFCLPWPVQPREEAHVPAIAVAREHAPPMEAAGGPAQKLPLGVGCNGR